MLAVIVVQCEQPADPDDGIPFREPKPVGKVTVLVRDHERIKLINVREDSNRWHIPAHYLEMDILGRMYGLYGGEPLRTTRRDCVD
jgi:hypothetical protein